MKMQQGLLHNNSLPSTDLDGVIVDDGKGEVLIPSDWIIKERIRLYKPKNIILPWWYRLFSKERLLQILKNSK